MVCHQCVEVHDHHCVWVNNCIGRDNYRTFLVFIWLVTLYLGLYTWEVMTYAIVGPRLSTVCALEEDRVSCWNEEEDSRMKVLAWVLSILGIFFFLFQLRLDYEHFVNYLTG